MLPKLIRNFRQKYPLVTFDIFTATADLVKEQMDKGLLDLNLLLEPFEIGKYEFICRDMKERWVALMPPDDPLAEKEVITAGELAELPLIRRYRANWQAGLAWKREQPFSLATTKFIEYAKYFLGNV